MFSKPIDNSLKGHFQLLYDRADNRANVSFSELHAQLPKLDHFHQLDLLVTEDKRIDELIADHDHPYYVNNDSPENLLTQFANRTYLLGIDESNELEEAIFLTKYHRLLFETIKKLKVEIPKYTFQMLLNGESCPYYLRFNRHYTTDEKNYNAIRDWQAAAMQKIVTYEYLMLIKGIQSYCRDLEAPLEFVLQQKEKAEFVLDEAELEVNTIITLLQGLPFLSDFDPQNFDAELLLANLKKYRDHELNLMAMTVDSVKKPFHLISKKFQGLISTEVTLFFTIDKIADWLDDVIKGAPLFELLKEPKWNSLISGVKYKAGKEVKILTRKIEEIAYDDQKSESEIKAFLIDQFEIYRSKFNAFEHKSFFYMLKKGNEDVLRRSVIANAFFGNDTSGQLELLKEAIIIHDMSWLIVQIFAELFDTHRIHYPDEDRSYFAVHSLLNSMVLDKEIFNAIKQSLDDFMIQFENYSLPFDIISRNQRENAHHIFHRAIQRLQRVLDNAEPSNKILYLQSRLKELKQRELQMKEFSEERFGEYDDRYSLFLKDFLLLEADFINQTKDITPSIPLNLANKPITLIPTATLDGLISKDKQTFLFQLLEDLAITKDRVCMIGMRKKGAIRGVVEAMLENNILPQRNLDILCKMIAKEIQLELKSKLDYSDVSESYKRKAVQYIKEHYPGTAKL